MQKNIPLLITTLSLLLITNSSNADDNHVPNNNPDLNTAKAAAKCAGLYDFLTLLYQVKRDQARIHVANTEMEDWKKTTKAAFIAAGLTRVKATVKTDALIEKERQRYLYFMESTPKHLYPEIEAGLETCESNIDDKKRYTN